MTSVDGAPPVSTKRPEAAPAPVTPRAAQVVDRVAPVLAAVVAVVLSWWLTGTDGPRISPDGVVYLSTASRLLHGHGLTFYDGHALTIWSPGYPMLLAAAGLVARGHLIGCAQVLNLLIAASIAVLGWKLARRHLGPYSAAIVILAYVLDFRGLLTVTTWVYSEPFFTALLLGMILELERVDDGGDTRWRPLVVAAVLGGLAAVTRWAGVQTLLGASLAVLLLPAASRAVRAKRVVAFGAIAYTPLVLLMARNLARTGTLAGPRVSSSQTFTTLWTQTIHVLAAQLVPDLADTPGVIMLSVVAAVVVAAVVVLVVRRARAGSTGRAVPRLTPGPLACVTVVGLGLLLMSSLSLANSIDARVLHPTLLPLVVLAASAVRRALAGIERRPVPRGWQVAGVALTLLLVAGWGAAAVRAYSIGSTAPREDYSAERWRLRGPAMKAALVPFQGIWSNQPDAVWLLTGRVAKSVPESHLRLGPDSVAEQRKAFAQAVRRHPGSEVIVWIHDPKSPALEPPEHFLLEPRLFGGRYRFQAVAGEKNWAVLRVYLS